MNHLPHNFFLRKEITCPICKSPFGASLINPRLYAADSREEDRHVTRYNWAQSIKTDILPHHYGVWHCPSCLYTALSTEFELSAPTARHRTRWTSYRQLPLPSQLKIRTLVKLLDSNLPYDAVTITTLHALAIWMHHLVPDEEKTWMDMGRLYLRIAWIYREQPLITEREGQAGQVRQNENDNLSGMQTLNLALDESLQKIQEQIGQISSLAEKRHRELGTDPYTTLLDSLNQRLRALRISERTFSQVLQRDLNNQLGGGTKKTVRPPLRGLAQHIATIWDAFPQDEVAATRACVDAFDKGIRLGEGGDMSVDAQLTVLVTNVKLLERIADFRGGISYIATISKMAFSEKQDLSRKIREMEKAGQGPESRRPLIRQLNTVNAVLQNFSQLREQLTLALIEQEGTDLENRLHAVKTRSEQIKILDERDIPTLIYRQLEDNGWLIREG